MADYPQDKKGGLPQPTISSSSTRNTRSVTAVAALVALSLASVCLFLTHRNVLAGSDVETWSGTTFTHEEICPGLDGRGTSHSGYIALKGDSEEHPKKSFYWCVLHCFATEVRTDTHARLFDAQYDSTNAPVM